VPFATATKAVGLLSLAVLAILIWRAVGMMPARHVSALPSALLWTFVALIVVVAFEAFTNQLGARSVLSYWPSIQDPKHVHVSGAVVTGVSEVNVNRRTALVALLLWPSLHLATTRPVAERFAALAGIAFCAAVILVWSGHQSSQLGITAGLVAFAASFVCGKWAVRAGYASWTALALLIVPLVLLVNSAGLAANPSLFASARHRVVIWTYTAKAVGLSPFVGIGADATAALNEKREMAGDITRADGGFQESTARHAHNIFLQVWYELGAVGALGFAAAGVGALWLLAGLRGRLLAFCLAHFTCVAGTFAFSYSLWQVWFEAAIVMSLVVMAVSYHVDRLARVRSQVS
jgi:O-antigen ligase